MNGPATKDGLLNEDANRSPGLELTFLGSGTSAGVPMIGCGCGACRSSDPRDRRGRPAALVRWPDAGLPDTEPNRRAFAFNPDQAGVRQVMIDAGPDMREQAMRHGLSRLDAVVYTHAHADHVMGTDDLRRFNAAMEAPLDVYAEPLALETLRQMFRYIFEPLRNPNQTFIARLIAFAMEAGQPIDLHGARWTPVRLMHGRLPIVGLRIDFAGASIAYCTDVSTIPPESWPLLEGLDVVVLDGLRFRHHPTHMTVDRACEVAESLGARRTYLTHISHDIVHAELSEQLPQGVRLAYDGMTLDAATLAESDLTYEGTASGPAAQQGHGSASAPVDLPDRAVAD
ncbi:MAG: MBL fold metallo-hydrolase [Planctomycetota bacterium]